MFSPLEQFEILVLIPFTSFFLDLSLTNAAIYSLLVFFSLFVLFFLAISRPFLIPGRWQLVLEIFYSFILDMVTQQAGRKSVIFFPFNSYYILFYIRF